MRKPLSDAEVNLFSSSFHSMPVKILPLSQTLDDICSGRYEDYIHLVRLVLTHDGKAAYDKAKAHLAAVTFGGTFSPRRGNGYLQQHSGIVHGDLDQLADAEGLKRTLAADPHTAYVFISPSAIGLKVGVHVPMVTDDAGYKHAWQIVSTAYEQRYGGRWDPSGKDISRLCFVSYDPALYWNPQATVFDVPPKPIPEPRPAQPSVLRQGYRDQGYAERAIRTAVEMIQSAELGTRHHTRLRASKLLGGYIAGGLLTEEQAYGALAQALVGHTEDLERALKTVEDGLAYGKAHPITLEDLEAERHAWIEQHFPLDGDSQPRAWARYIWGARYHLGGAHAR